MTKRQGKNRQSLFTPFLCFFVLFLLLVFAILQLAGRPASAIDRTAALDDGSYAPYFCPVNNDSCISSVSELINASERSVHCAFFDLDLKDVIHALTQKSGKADVRVVIDNENADGLDAYPFIRLDTSSQYSHNKFCIFDDKTVLTGSMNPTLNGATKNNNHFVVFESRLMGENYEAEFRELWAGKFGEGEAVPHPRINLSSVIVENYFCPEDCIEGPGGISRVVELIQQANESIHVAMFSFTSQETAHALLAARQRGVDVSIVMEKRNMNGRGSQAALLAFQGIDIVPDNNSASMHHKFMVIDGRIVLFGSFNFSKNANSRNDENMVIVHDEDIATLFLDEFWRVKKIGRSER